VFVCKNPDCGWSGNADHNAARNVLHLYRTGLALIPAAGRAVVRREARQARCRKASRNLPASAGRALQHALMQPNLISDADGRYRGMDQAVHRLARGQRAQYSNSSG
jgi:hypothetical protein